MSTKYTNILVAVDGSKEAELAFKKGVNVALRNQSRLTIAHVVDTRSLQSIDTFDGEIYEHMQLEAESLLQNYKNQALDVGLNNVHTVVEFGNPKTLLATDIPEQEGIDLIMVGATGLNAFERLLIGSSSEYILRHAKVDLLVVREKDKTL